MVVVGAGVRHTRWGVWHDQRATGEEWAKRPMSARVKDNRDSLPRVSQATTAGESSEQTKCRSDARPRREEMQTGKKNDRNVLRWRSCSIPRRFHVEETREGK
jgi:hypothetical protein